MKAIIQRVLSASVTVDKEVVSSIGKGILVFAAVAPNDTEKEMNAIAAKVTKMRLWDDENGAKVRSASSRTCTLGSDKMQWKESVKDIGGEILCVSQFTLLARTKKGTKPDFHGAANPEDAKRLYDHFVGAVRKEYESDRVKDGVFQAMMEVALVNDGPVTLELQAGEKIE
ncbi:D-Tyr tRNAtyr deacylase-like domain-containing protein [Emericellopsis atlantica]|uniref:D-aminoacyl-tRNA deacylase n=1 Tax=Emericellopsis atlantica TaxID=2614577 RepID=A0A9P8CQY2_9HYPO|nr:D-Tyr tRNAtyr deacylase-like domain-containing protein [Emericellopsis atlantica]KAG9255747.1 D-Tyr tRNAtyr deacylase-like domain-containing protein [Emericellopsis atlantica]